MTEQQGEVKKVQSKTTMIIICLLAGSLGIHRLMMGYSNWWMQLLLALVCGVSYIWAIIDLINILQDKMPMADGRPLEK